MCWEISDKKKCLTKNPPRLFVYECRCGGSALTTTGIDGSFSAEPPVCSRRMTTKEYVRGEFQKQLLRMKNSPSSFSESFNCVTGALTTSAVDNCVSTELLVRSRRMKEKGL